jgi:hypothetical protein
LQQWTGEVNRPDVNWRDIAGPYTSELLAVQLYDSVKDLLNVKRSEEAYHLLVECLQTNPELPDALELMARFPIIRKSQSVIARYKFIFAGVVALALVFVSVVLVFNKVSDVDNAVSAQQGYGRSLFISSSNIPINGTDRSLPFKDGADTMKKLTGNLIITDHPETGSLFVDGRHVADLPDTFRLSARNIEHSVIWRVGNGVVLWKEIVTVRPFETKRICIKER